MTALGPHSALREVLAEPRARAALGRVIPEATLASLPSSLEGSAVSIALLVAGVSRPEMDALAEQLRAIPRPDPGHEPAITPDPAYEGEDVPLGSAKLEVPDGAAVNVPVEIVLRGPSDGNPFVDVDLEAEFRSGTGDAIGVGGFYDGDGRYLLRFLPPAAGEWTFAVTSTARSLDGVTGSFAVRHSEARGPVRVADEFAFAHANGEPFVPVGTTAYAWTHQTDELEAATLETLQSSAFTKVRMGIFPKHFDYNSNEPRWFPFERRNGAFDLTRFDLEYFRHLERRLRELDALGVQADLILFHPYDRWGFADLGPAADERYLTYVVRRLAAFPNVWWSMANEYDFVSSKDVDDWDRLARIVYREDHAGHLLSIHNGVYLYDYAADWATHASLQRNDVVRSTELALELRARWGKPVVFDEMGYEGDLEYEWGNVPPAEVVRQFWEGMIGGGYVTHGETYWNEEEELFWAKGGRLTGEAPSRIAFLARIAAESPSGRLEPLSTGIRGKRAGVGGRYELQYLGLAQPRVLTTHVPAGTRAYIDVLDTWGMTIETLPGLQEGSVAVPLPAKPYMAIRMRVVEEAAP